MIRGSSVAESGQTGARSGWFVALSVVTHSGHWEEICTLMIRGSVGEDSLWSRGGVGAIRSTIGYIGAHYCLVRAHSGQCNGGFTH